MLRVLGAGMRTLGLISPPSLPPGRLRATVDLDLKRSVIGAAVAQGGLACLPLLGRGLHQLPHDPTHRALTTGADPAGLFARWLRLERYIHSRHRTRLLRVDRDGAVAEHLSLRAAVPLAVEDLVVVGVLCALLEAIGLHQVQAWAGDAAAYPRPDAAALDRAAAAGHTARWTFRWRPQTATPSALRRAPPAADIAADDHWPPLARDGFARLAAELIAPPPVAQLAADLNTSARSLQRLLAAHQLSYSQLLAEARCRSAALRLLHASTSIAEIGFVCGYADQPHFTREFRERVGVTPARYRSDFAATASAAHASG